MYILYKADGYNFSGYCRAMRFEFTQDLQGLNEAVQLQERAVELAHSQSSRRNDYLHNLRNTLIARYRVSRGEADLKRIQQIESEIGVL